VLFLKRFLLLTGLFRLLVRPSIVRLRGAKIGRLVVLGEAVIKGRCANLEVGDQSSLGKCELTLHDAVQIGRCVAINDGAVLLTASHHVGDPSWSQKKGAITVGDYAWIATNAIILPGVSIGRGAVVGAGAVVRSNVADYAVVTGNPAALQVATRAKSLRYSPALLNAPFEAWIGGNIENMGISLD
jgi:maltose O-acetyltransferase